MTNKSLVLCVAGLGAWVGCSGGGSESAGSGRSDGGSWSAGSGGGGGSAATIKLDAAAVMAADAAPQLPPEQEQNLDFLAPRAGATYVYVANPARNTVTAINSSTLAIKEQAPGDSPTYLATVPGQDVALVINVGSHTLRILRGEELAGDPIPIIPKANAIAIAPDGLHAVVWFDAGQSSSTQTSAATGSTQEVSVVDLASNVGSAISMSVGYNPTAVVFSSDSAAAFVVTDDGISELRFAQIAGPAIAPFTRIDNGGTVLVRPDAGTDVLPDAGEVGGPVSDGAATEAGSAEAGAALDGGASDEGSPRAPVLYSGIAGKPTDVSVTPDGAYAVARREGTDQLLLVNLKTHVVQTLELGSPVTDLDLLPSGTAAFAVLRERSTLVRVDIPSGFTDAAHRKPWQLQGPTIGSVTVSSKGTYAVLYTTAVESKNLVILSLDTDDPQPQTVELQKGIRAVAVAPDESTALVLHTRPSTTGAGGSAGGSSTTPLDKAFGYTMVRLSDGFRKLQLTAADPNPFAITPNSTYAFVLLRDDKAGVRIAERISLRSFVASDYALGSPPSSIAALSEGARKVFVGQVYSEGRISFIDWETGDVQTVTGFALNGRIQQ